MFASFSRLLIIVELLQEHYESRNPNKRTFGRMCLTKTHICLCVRAVWSELRCLHFKHPVSLAIQNTRRTILITCANMQADLNILWAHMP